MEINAAAAAFLDAVKGLVGIAISYFKRHILGLLNDAKAAGNRRIILLFLAERRKVIINLREDSFKDIQVLSIVHREDDEFIAADAEDAAWIREGFAQFLGDFRQNDIAEIMAIGIVDAFEAIDVGDDEEKMARIQFIAGGDIFMTVADAG